MTRPRPAGPPALRRHNLGLVLSMLRAAGSASRAELAARTGLTRATVATLLEPLLDAGVLAEDAATPRGVGRPSRAVRFAPRGPVALGVAVDVDTLAVCALGLDGVTRILRRVERDHRHLPPAAVFDGAAALATEVRGEVGAPVLGVGLALPALLGSPAAHPDAASSDPADRRAFGTSTPRPPHPRDPADRPTPAPRPPHPDKGADRPTLRPCAAPPPDPGDAADRRVSNPTGCVGDGPAAMPLGPRAAAPSSGGPPVGAPMGLPVEAAATPVVLRAPNLPRMAGSRPAAELAVRLGLPVTVGNEATLGALAHLDLAPDLVYVSAGIGIGGGVVLGGRVYRGVHGLAGELGHVVVERDGPICGCGGRGCVERYAGTTALLAEAGVPDLSALEAALARGDGRAVAATTHAAAALGVGLASVLNVLDVPVVVLGGTYAHLAPHALPALHAELGRRTLLPGPVRVLVSDQGDAAVVRGAAESILDEVQRDPDRLLAVECDISGT